MLNIKKFKKDVRGAALVYVIVAAAIIVLLGAATTATAYVNLRTTQVQKQSDNNFYSADTVMNAIVSGLEADISEAYETAYTQVITKLNTYGEMSEAKGAFDAMFLNLLSDELDDDDLGSQFYSTNKIQGYAEAVLKDDINYTISAIHGDSFLDSLSDSLVLRNLHVTYEDDSGYFDEITTDIKIAIPEFNPEMIQNPPSSLTLNAFVVDDGLEIDVDKGLQINGNAYINERESDKSAVLMKDKTSLSIVSPIETILGGHIKTEENTLLVLKGTAAETDGNLIWTENFDLGRYTEADLSGQIFVYDDLEINGSYSDVRLAGEYYGYSKSDTLADESSSMNVNGAHAKLDIQKLDMLVLAGSSYLSTTTITPGGGYSGATNDLQLGEALSVKSNQIAYFVDDKEFTVSDVPGFVSNPMSYAQYENMVALNGSWTNVANKLTSKPLSYGKSYGEFGASIVPVFSSTDNGTVYLYLSFSNPDKAADYFTTAYKGNTLLSQRLRTYAAQYITSLKLNTDSSLLVNENYIDSSVSLYTEDNLPTIMDGLGYDQNKPDQTSMDSILTQIRNQYLDNGQVGGKGEKYKVMYQKLINQDKLKEFVAKATDSASKMDHHTNNELTIVENGVSLMGTNGAKAVVVDNAGKEAFELGTGKGIAIISGDVELTGDWLGTIIVGGRAYCTEGSKVAPLDITIDDVTVSSVIPLYFAMTSGDSTQYMSVMNIFNGYENLSANNATNDDGINADMISNCLTFTNWNKS